MTQLKNYEKKIQEMKQQQCHYQNSLSSLSHFASHILSSPFAVSVHILPSTIYTSSSTFLTPSSQWLADGCPTPVDISCHCGEVKMFVSILRKVTVYDLKNRGIWPPNWILLDPGREFFKPQELGWMGSVDMAIRLDNFLFNLW